jgi:hypothetical protein
MRAIGVAPHLAASDALPMIMAAAPSTSAPALPRSTRLRSFAATAFPQPASRASMRWTISTSPSSR